MHVFHILKKTDWSGDLLSVYQAGSLKEQGFIHCCTEEQIPGVISKWFSEADQLLIMEIDPDLLQSKLVYENLEGGKEIFPHIYGPIDPEAILQVRDLQPPLKKEYSKREPITIDKFITRLHFIFDQGWFLLTCGDFVQGDFNCMTISWGLLGTMWNLPVAMVAVRYSRQSFKFMDKFDSFSLNSFSEQYRDVLNELGSHSGREMDKIHYPKITPMPSQHILSPSFHEAELVLECKKLYWEDMNPAHFMDVRIWERYPRPDYHRFFIGEVIGIYGTEKFLLKSLP